MWYCIDGNFLFILKLVIPISSATRFLNIPIIIVYTLIGGSIYFVYMIKTKSIQEVFGDKLLKKFQKNQRNKLVDLFFKICNFLFMLKTIFTITLINKFIHN